MDEQNQIPEIPEPQKDEAEKGEFTESKNLPLAHITPAISPVGAAFIGLFGGFFLYQIIGGLLAVIIFGLDLENAPINGVRLITMSGQILFILLPALLFSKWFYQDVGTIIRFKFPKWQEVLLFVLGIIILTPLLQTYLYIQNYYIDQLAVNYGFVNDIKSFFDSLNEMVEKTYGNLITAHSVIEGLLVIMVIAIVPAVCEEVMFRGFIQRSFEFKMRPFWAAAITAVFFAVYHFNPYAIIPLMILGFYFGFAAYISNSIFVPMILHFLNNFAAVILFFIFGDDELIKSSPSIDHMDFSVFALFFVFLVLFIGVIIMIKVYYSSARNR
jgi:membrane protease YdiL (CAAX protease family)